MKKVGFLGCGKIGRAMLKDLLAAGIHKVTFVQDPVYPGDQEERFPVIANLNEELLKDTDIVIEAANAGVLKENAEKILENCDLMILSVTALSDVDFYEQVNTLAGKYNRKIYLPHGAILGVDGIADANSLITSITIETVKNPASLGREDSVRTIVFEGPTREACREYPRNVNVHATVALAGIGFDETHSVIVSDPGVSTNTHRIIVDGEGIHFELLISSHSTGGVTGKYTPYSAAASLHRVLDEWNGFHFV